MKRNLLTLAVAGAIALGSFALVQAQPGHGGGGRRHGGGFALERMTEELNLTADQQTKVQPILDQAKPQIAAARQKIKAIMDSTMSQIRPLLTADQQKKLDDIQKAGQDRMNARNHDAGARP